MARGIDPSGQMKLDRIAASVAAANTFKAVAEEWYAKAAKEGLAPATLNKIRWLLDFAYQSSGNRPIAEILPHELLALLRKFEARGKHESTKRLRSTCEQVFRYAIATARANRDISADLRGALISVPYSSPFRILRRAQDERNHSSPIRSAAMNASCGMLTLPYSRIRALPFFCLSSSFFLRLMSPP